MARRSLPASPQGIQDIKKALKRKKWSQTYIAGAVGCSRQTIWSLLQGNPTDCDVFMEICTQLGLNWEEIAEPESPQLQQDESQELDALVREVRERVQPYIQEKCGTMRVLDMSQPIELGNIYTSVNILEKLTRTRGLDLAALMRDTDPKQFDRFCLGDVRERRVPGLEAVKKFSKLMILGKPGAGKTTFLKHLAIQCIGGTFQSNRVPVFITLKDFAEADGKPNLLKYIDQFAISPVGAGLVPTRHQEAEHPQEVPLQRILGAGRALILLDGLDEVRDADSSRVLHQIREFSQQFIQNQFLITCRIAAREYTFEQFTEVEIADFDDEQIADFSSKWFRCKNDPIKAERFVKKLKEDAPIRELATSPLLLTLLCLVFEDSGSFPTNRAELYQNGVDVLLKKWDVKRNIEREQVYKRLSLKRKEYLLSQIARTTFEAGNYFFKQREVERYISQYIQNLPDASTDPEALELDSVAVLKSIEARHGLFVERARGIYSFSHLTFHEYFTARKIVTSCNPYAIDDPTLQGLVSHVAEKRWREVFLLTVGMVENSDTLLQRMKQAVDEFISGDTLLQHFMIWLSHKSDSLKAPYKLIAVRAFFFELACRNTSERDRHFTSLLDPEFHYARNHEFDFDCTRNINLDRTLTIGCEYAHKCHQIFRSHQVAEFRIALTWADGIDYSLNHVLSLNVCEKFQFAIAELKTQLPNVPKFSTIINDFWIRKEFIDWWTRNSSAWIAKLRSVMIEYRNIGHDWQFTDAQKKLLQQYYDANKLLVHCLNSDCYVSREVRQEIEETLLLPIAEIKKRRSCRDDGVMGECNKNDEKT